MDAATMRRALELESLARRLLKQHNEYTLLRVDSSCTPEVINVGDPVNFRKDEYHRMKVAIPDEARRYVFGLWKRETALKYNAIVRELNQIGMTTDLRPLPTTRPVQPQPRSSDNDLCTRNLPPMTRNHTEGRTDG